jgi:outer membrane protein assembly factor BamB
LSLEDGRERWAHVDETRFEEPIAGAGPRATPTFANGRIFTMGGNGLVSAFDAATGEKLWSHDLPKEFEAGLKEELNPAGTEESKKTAVPMWGFAGSPLVIGDKVIVYVGAKDKGVAVFNAVDGKPGWSSGSGGHSYTSPHLATIAGVGMILNTSNKAIQGLDPESGKLLWSHDLKLGQVVPCVQPSVQPGDRVAIGTSFGIGTDVVSVVKSGESFSANKLDTFRTFKPYFSDYVTVGDIAYGFDGAYFCCVDLKTGKKLWNAGRRYGAGQVLLLADQNLLLVTSEMDGNVVLVPVDQSGHKETARFKAVTGKTWNHPVLAHGKLIVRNGEEIACFDVAEK